MCWWRVISAFRYHIRALRHTQRVNMALRALHFARSLARAADRGVANVRRGCVLTRTLSSTPSSPPPAEVAKMHMMFTCNKCETRALKSFSKRSYESGVVIATCPGCEARHLIADNLGWFGEERNIEEIMRIRGVHVPVLSDLDYAPPVSDEPDIQ